MAFALDARRPGTDDACRRDGRSVPAPQRLPLSDIGRPFARAASCLDPRTPPFHTEAGEHINSGSLRGRLVPAFGKETWMPGREDFGILRSRFLADDRAQRAAELYVERGMALDPMALGAVTGHVVQLGLWAMRETDAGILPGDGIGAVHQATMMPRDWCRKVIDALHDAGLLRDVDGGLYLVGFLDCYGRVLTVRQKNAESHQRSRSDTKKDVPGTSVGRPEDVPGTSVGRPEDVPGTSVGPGSESCRPEDVPGMSTGRPASRAPVAVPELHTVATDRTVPDPTRPSLTAEGQQPPPYPSPNASSARSGGRVSSASPGATTAGRNDSVSPSDRMSCDIILTKLCQTSGFNVPATPVELAFAAERRLLRAGQLPAERVQVLIASYGAKYADEVTKARASSRRDARAARAETKQRRRESNVPAGFNGMVADVAASMGARTPPPVNGRKPMTIEEQRETVAQWERDEAEKRRREEPSE